MPHDRIGHASRIRAREEITLRNLRTRHATRFGLAERILDLGVELADGQRIRHATGDRLVGRVLAGLYVKMLAVFWALIVLAERGLPSSSLMRELVEALISLKYIAEEDSGPRAGLYRDYLPIRRLKDMNRRLNDPDSRDTVTLEFRQAVDAAVAEIVAGRGLAFVDGMKGWQTWGGDFSLETMARRAGLPGTIYNLPYSVESRAVHALDAADYLTLDDDGTLRAQMPDRLDQHLVPASMTMLTAMDTFSTQFGLHREAELRSLLEEVTALNQERRRQRGEGSSS